MPRSFHECAPSDDVRDSSVSRRGIVRVGTTAAVLAMAVFVSVLVEGAADASSCTLTGAGDSDSPFLVSNATDLGLVGQGACALNAHYRQTSDITLGAVDPGQSNHTHIGSKFGTNQEFTGTYDGQDFSIIGLSMEPGPDGVGLFGATKDATLRNIRIQGGSVRGRAEVGALVGNAHNTTIEFVESSASVAGSAVGGLVGYARGGTSIRLSVATGSVEITNGGNSGGGLVGLLENSEVSQSVARGAVTGSPDVGQIGGLIGQMTGSSAVVERSWADGVVSNASHAGGLVGQVRNGASVRTSFAIGAVTTERGPAGGLVGELQGDSAISASFATGAVDSGSDSVGAEFGGLIGRMTHAGASVTNSFARGSVRAQWFVGGLIGSAIGTVTNSFAAGDVSGAQDLGGLIGKQYETNQALTVTGSFWDIDGTGQNASVGGGTGTSTAGMKSIATFAAAGWSIDEEWFPYDPVATPPRIWAICSGENAGYPVLQWRLDEDSCASSGTGGGGGGGGGGLLGTQSGGSDDAGTIALACAPQAVRVGDTVTCSVTGGVPDIDVLWRAEYNPEIERAGVRLGEDGSGNFSFIVPPSALGAELQVELVGWMPPMSLGVVEGVVPVSVPTGEGPPRDPIWPVALLALGWLMVFRGDGSAWPKLRTTR